MIERRVTYLETYELPNILVNELDKDLRIVTYKEDKRIVLPSEYRWAELWMDAYLPVKKGNILGVNWGLLNENLDIVLECKYNKIIGVKNNTVIALNKYNQLIKVDIISKKEILLKYVYISNTDDSICVRDFGSWQHYKEGDVNNYGLLDFEGNIVLECIYDKLYASISGIGHDCDF